MITVKERDEIMTLSVRSAHLEGSDDDKNSKLSIPETAEQLIGNHSSVARDEDSNGSSGETIHLYPRVIEIATM